MNFNELGHQIEIKSQATIARVKAVFDEENNIIFKNPLNGETKEYPLYLWFVAQLVMKQYYVKHGWIQVDKRGMKI
jgi:hypothetical protein